MRHTPYIKILQWHRHATVALATMLAVACGGAHVPETYTESDALPPIYPDYVDVTVPVNIAPLTFMPDTEADDMVTRFTADGTEVVCGGLKAQPSESDWRSLKGSGGGDISVDVYLKHGEQWTHMRTFAIHVSKDSIDAYLSYRLISPSYVTYEELTINQRCLESYDESVVYDNMLCSTEASGQCINCHNYQQYNPQRMQFHARQRHGGTVISYDGVTRKVNMRSDSLLSAGVYPTWHPWQKLIVYSTNKTGQSFHTRNLNKIEVFDSESDLIAYDVEHNEVTNIACDSTEHEVYPFWAPDGRWLYFCSAHFEFRDTVSHDVETILRAKELKYSIYRMAFDPATRRFGEREMVFAAADSLGMSATLPRISPDGRYLMFAMAEYGVFHIWHRDADLWIMDLNTGQARPMDELNSADTESYHSWSSNGRWVVFSTRRDDGGYTRPFLAHVDAQGRGAKPFELPQADPACHRELMKSYNIPELMTGPVTITPQQFADVLKTDGETVTYVEELRNEK